MSVNFVNKSDYIKLSKEFNTNPLQSYAWGQIKKGNWYPDRLGIYKGSDIVALVTILTRKIPLLNKKFGYIPRGISIKDKKLLPFVLEEIKKASSNLVISHIIVDPGVDFESVFKDKQSNIKKIYESNRYKETGRQEQPIRTVVIDLSKSEKELLSDMRSKHRQYIRKAGRNNVKVTKGNDENIDDFCRIIDEIKKERNYTMHETDYYRKVWKFFREEGSAEIFVARVEKDIIGTYMIIFSDRNVYEMFGGCNKKGRNLLANYALKWECIKYSKEIGKKFYDQWGAEHAHPGLVQFKEGFGGKVIKYPSQYTYVRDKVGYFIYKVSRRIRTVSSKLQL